MLIDRHHRRVWAVAGLLAGVVLAVGPATGHPGIDQQIADVTALLEASPDDAALYLRRGELHRIHRGWAAAEADFRRARKLDRTLAEVDLALGTMKLDAGDPGGANKVLTRYLRRRPDSVTGLVARARALAKLGRNLDASRDYSRALTLAERGRPQPDYYLEQARVLEAAGPEHVAEALEVLDRGLERLSHPVTLQLYAIELELSMSRHEAALKRLDEIAGRATRKETWLLRRGEILESAGRNDEARTAYLQTLEAVEKLPVSRRGNAAVRRLVAEAESALQRLEAMR